MKRKRMKRWKWKRRRIEKCEEEKHVKVEETAGAKEGTRRWATYCCLERGLGLVGSEMKEDGVRSRTGLHTSIHRRSPAPTGFFSVSSPPPGPLWLYLPAARPTFYSNLLVLTCSLLYPLLSRDPPPFTSFPTFPPSACRPHSRASGVGPQCSIHRATKRTAQASADLPGSHFRLDGNPRDTHTVDVVSVLLSIPLIAKDLNSQTVRGVRSARGQF